MKFKKLAFLSVILLFTASFYSCSDELEEIGPEFNPTEDQLDLEKKKQPTIPPPED